MYAITGITGRVGGDTSKGRGVVNQPACGNLVGCRFSGRKSRGLHLQAERGCSSGQGSCSERPVEESVTVVTIRRWRHGVRPGLFRRHEVRK
jgi:hypothetical protein